MSQYFDIHGLDKPFTLFSVGHLVSVAVILFAVLVLYRFREALREPRANRLFRMNLAGVVLLSEVALESWQAWMGGWTLDYSLPLQLCSISLLFAVVMLWNRSYRLFEFMYLAGMGGALQAILTPDLGHYAFPHFRAFEFFVAHGGIVLACLFMVFVEGMRPTLGSLWRALLMLNGIAAVVYVINRLTGGNYMFLAHKPSSASLLDVLGSWPWYLVSLEGVALGMFVVLYLPFLFRRKSANYHELARQRNSTSA
ncbi:MAG TPA: TIGR02206 family membrane protein [Bacilli bacterium]|nr:TIGR02206 family membrane protein [Bacilli bacterium]